MCMASGLPKQAKPPDGSEGFTEVKMQTAVPRTRGVAPRADTDPACTGGANPVGPFLAHRGSAVPVVNPAKRN